MKYLRTLIIAAALAALVVLPGTDTLGRGRGGAGGGAAAVGSRSVVGPYGGGGTATRTTKTVVGPVGGTGTTATKSGSFTTPGGTTIKAGTVGGKFTTPGGTTVGKGVGGVQVTGPGGQSATKVGHVAGAVGPGGNGAIKTGTIGKATGPGGTVVGGSRGGVAVGPGGAVAGGTRGAIATGPYGGLKGYTTRGAAVTTGHRTNYDAAGSLRTYGATVRTGFGHYNSFGTTWYTSHANAWRAPAWTVATFWTGVAWGRLSSYCGYPVQPVIYDYGTTIIYEGDNVYYNGEQIASADEYTQQATDIATIGIQAKPPEKEEWVSLGVWGMVPGEETDANNVFQLAINKDGVIRGNYYNALSDTTTPVYGSVDKKTQRAAWIVGDHKETVYETGIGNLSEKETSLLVHLGKDRTQQWIFIQLEKPEEQK